ncbi:hypothetical protein ZHAS_00022011 [Anopheles sinensis]|uniref:Uncharacterized protein n=1 Tax=Anopheles sinensis TaxID=74873 RepID=A0A084WU83_ANOSI|nr:hypothetical protein ZHAS_00022011 [Anopheles sinensis]
MHCSASDVRGERKPSSRYQQSTKKNGGDGTDVSLESFRSYPNANCIRSVKTWAKKGVCLTGAARLRNLGCACVDDREPKRWKIRSFRVETFFR